MEYAQLLTDTGLSANWVMAILLGVAIYFQKRANDKADKREAKVDSILEKISETLADHGERLAVHETKLSGGIEVHITKDNQ